VIWGRRRRWYRVRRMGKGGEGSVWSSEMGWLSGVGLVISECVMGGSVDS